MCITEADYILISEITTAIFMIWAKINIVFLDLQNY